MGLGDADATVKASLFEDLVDIVLHCADGDPQYPGNLFVGQAVGDQGGHLALAWRERLQAGRRQRRTRRQTHYDQRLPEIGRCAEIDSDARAQLHLAREADDLGERRAVRIVDLKLTHHGAQLHERSRIDLFAGTHDGDNPTGGFPSDQHQYNG